MVRSSENGQNATVSQKITTFWTTTTTGKHGSKTEKMVRGGKTTKKARLDRVTMMKNLGKNKRKCVKKEEKQRKPMKYEIHPGFR